MPGFTTHYLFGLNAYKLLEPKNSVKELISKNHSVYSLGLQGPDFFFYYLPSYLFFHENPGSIAHTSRTGDFLKNLLGSYKLFPDPEDAQIAKAYIFGYLGHYVLDSTCHPYIYAKTHFTQKTSQYYGKHIHLEVDIDKELLSFFKHKKPSVFRQEATIVFSTQQIKIVNDILYHVFSLTYPEIHLKHKSIRLALRSMQLGIRLLHDKDGRKKVLIRKLEGALIGYPVLSPMISSNRFYFYMDPLNILHNTWKNPWNKNLESTQSFLDLMNAATRDFIKILALTNETFQNAPAETTQALHQILGNKSFHSGLSSNIPS